MFPPGLAPGCMPETLQKSKQSLPAAKRRLISPAKEAVRQAERQSLMPLKSSKMRVRPSNAETKLLWCQINLGTAHLRFGLLS